MRFRAGMVALTVAATLPVAGCTTATDDRPRAAERTPSPTPTTTTASPTPSRTALPTRGEPGFEDLPSCFGRRATILGTRGDDRIEGTAREDVIVTGAGDDVVEHLRREDRVCAGAGDDSVQGADHWQISIDLAAGNDRVAHSGRISTLRAGRGDDRLTLIGNNPTYVVLGPGRDTLVVQRDPSRRPPNPYNSPCVQYHRAPVAMRIDLTRGWARGWGDDRLTGVRCLRLGRFADVVVGSAAADSIDVGGGANRVWALAGRDGVFSDASFGNDVFYLGDGNDSAMSGVGADRV